MPLEDRAVLEIDGNLGPYEGKTGVFVLREDLEDTEETSISHIAGNRGQYLSELYDQITDVSELIEGPEQRDRRAGYHIDGGAGEDVWTLTGVTSVDDPDEQWGTGDTDPNDPSDITQLDGTGCSPTAKRDILGAWIAQNRVDSSTPGRLYRGEWADGTYSDSAGVFGRPIPVVVQETRLERTGDDAAGATIAVTLVRTSRLPNITDAADDITGALSDAIPDY
mgnify:CR=1 FL=1